MQWGFMALGGIATGDSLIFPLYGMSCSGSGTQEGDGLCRLCHLV